MLPENGGSAMLFLILLTLLFVLILSYIAYWIAFYNPVYRHHEAVVIHAKQEPDCFNNLCRSMENRRYEQIQIRGFDGVALVGRYYHQCDGAPLFILFHGYRGNGIRDFCAVHGICSKLGINTLVVDQRAHGSSGGNTMTFGILERYDCRAWAHYACRRFGTEQKIYLHGVSMGAATVLMASNLSLPSNVTGIIADCPYSCPGLIIRKVIRDMHFPPSMLYPFVVLGAMIFGRFRIWEEKPAHAVSEAKIPILLIHGSDDKYVPSEMSAEIFEQCSGKRYLEIFPGAGHGGCSVTDPIRYEKVLRAFLKNCK